MKLRIVSNGKIFRVERKWFFRGWITDHHENFVGKAGSFSHGFETYDAAEKWIEEKYGTSAEINRTWVTAGELK